MAADHEVARETGPGRSGYRRISDRVPWRLVAATALVIIGAITYERLVNGEDADSSSPPFPHCDFWSFPCDDSRSAGTTGDPHPSPNYSPTTYADPPEWAAEPACPPDGNQERRLAFTGVPPMCIDPDMRYTATISTNYGLLPVTLNTPGAPWTVNNFVYLARWHYYDGIQLIPSPQPTEPTVIPQDVWTHLLSLQPIDPGTTTEVPVPGYSLVFETHDGSYANDETLYLVMVDSQQPDQFAIVVSPEGHQQVADRDGTYPLLGEVTSRCRNVLAQRDLGRGGWDVRGTSEAIVIESIDITEEPATTPTTLPPVTNTDPCGRLAATQD